MNDAPADFDATRAALAEPALLATATAYLTTDVAVHLPWEAVATYKGLLKRFFSSSPWTEEDDAALSALVRSHIASGWWEHDLGGGITLTHGIRSGEYRLRVTGAAGAFPSIFDRTFDGPVVPEATPHPRKVKFAFAGTPSPGKWYRRTDPEPSPDPRVKRLFMERDVTDVMVAGNFITVGLAAGASWERRLEPLLGLVTELAAAAGPAAAAKRTREELLREAGHLRVGDLDAELHLLDPDAPDHRARLEAALRSEDARKRRVAVAVLAEADDPGTRRSALQRGCTDASRLVRRTAVDAAGDAADAALRPLLETALGDGDPWIRWRAVKALGVVGVGTSVALLEGLRDDPEFRVRFEVERVLRDPAGAR